MKNVCSVLMLLLLLIPYKQNAQQQQSDMQRMLQSLKQSGIVRQEGSHLIFKVKNASDTAQVKMMYAALFKSDQWTIGFDPDEKNGDKKNKQTADISGLFKKENTDPVYDVAKPNTAVISNRLSSSDERFLQSGSFLIRTARDYRYLTSMGDVPLENSQLRINSFLNNPERQQWKLVLQNDGYFKIQSENGLCLTQGLVPTLKAFSNAETQLWYLEDAGNGNYRIISKRNLCMYLPNHRNVESGGISFRNKNKTIEEKWQLIRWTNDERRITSFSAESNGFRFLNTFNGEDIIRWGGLCGGMVYTALDYFNHNMDIPRQYYTPANGTALQSYLYTRQNHAVWDVNAKWSELEVSYNTRANEIFKWGLQGSGGGRLQELKSAIDANTPVPIGLFAGGVHGKDNSDGGRHVVLALGYATGRYTGDMGAHQEDFKMFVYNPNEGNTIRTLVPDLENKCYFEVETGNAWRTYFVNQRYDNSHIPTLDYVNYPEGQEEGNVRHLYATFITGNDDLRGGDDNVNITIHYTDGTEQVFLNVNNNARWVDNSIQTIHLTLNRAVQKKNIQYFILGFTSNGGVSGDNWNLYSFKVYSGHNGIDYVGVYPASEKTYYYRFSASQRFNTVSILP